MSTRASHGSIAESDLPWVDVRETHISALIFVGDRVFKVKKPVHFGFVDQTTAGDRASLCRREVEVNRRLSPDVYLGVAELRSAGSADVEAMVEMRRLPEDRRLSTLVQRRDASVPARLDEVARTMAGFHETASRSEIISAHGSQSAVSGRWTRNLDEMRCLIPQVFGAADLERVRALALHVLDRHAAQFDTRIAAGRVCDGHGDLQADDIFCLEDGPRVLDAIEFDAELRYADVIEDVAFLAMDLERLGRRDLSSRFVSSYEQHSGDRFPPDLLGLAVAYRAAVRAKVVGLRSLQQTGSDAESSDRAARDLLAICERHLHRIQTRLFVVGGLPGTGKSTLARALASRVDWEVVSSDEIRRTVVPAGEADERYTRANVSAVYDAMLARAGDLLRTGRSVVLDATFNDATHREAAAELARIAHVELHEIRCVVDDEIADRRIEARLAAGNDASEATTAVARTLRGTADAWEHAILVNTAQPVEQAVGMVLARTGLGPPTSCVDAPAR